MILCWVIYCKIIYKYLAVFSNLNNGSTNSSDKDSSKLKTKSACWILLYLKNKSIQQIKIKQFFCVWKLNMSDNKWDLKNWLYIINCYSTLVVLKFWSRDPFMGSVRAKLISITMLLACFIHILSFPEPTWRAMSEQNEYRNGRELSGLLWSQTSRGSETRKSENHCSSPPCF